MGLELRPLPSTAVTQLHRYYEPLRHPTAPSLSLTGVLLIVADHALGLPVFRALSLCTCCRQYRGAASGRRLALSPTRVSLPRNGYRVGLHKALIPGENHHIDIFEGPDGVWRGIGISMFAANQGRFEPAWKRELPGAKLVMRLHKGDLIELAGGNGGRRRIMRVVRLKAASSGLFLAEHMEAGQIQTRHDDRDDPFRWDMVAIGKLKERGARLVYVDEIGRVRR